MTPSLLDSLARRVERRPEATFARFLRYGQVEDICTFGELWELSRRWATLLIAHGLKQDEAVLLCLPNCLDFLGAYFGTIAAGGVPGTTAPPRRARPDAATIQGVRQRCLLARARLVVMTPEHAAVVAPTLSGAGSAALSVLTRRDLPEQACEHDRRQCALGTLQFTSGTSSTPKVVELSHRSLVVQAESIADWMQVTETSRDSGVSWLPFFHDMGLIGLMLAPALRGAEMTYLRNNEFLHWVRALSDYRATVTAGSPSAYAACARYAKESEFATYDLSALRAALVGAEMISTASLAAFATKFACVGFKSSAFVPAYGLAENGLAVTMTPLERGLRIDEVDAKLLQTDAVARPAAARAASRTLVACGVPIADTEVTIRDDQGHVLEERRVGEVVVRTGSLMDGYRDAEAATRESLRDGWLWTGDLGYLADGDLYVLGRKKEVIIVAGNNYHPQEFEDLVNTIPGVHPGRTVAVGMEDPERLTDAVVVLAESSHHQAAERAQLRRTIRERLTEADYPVQEVILLAPRTIRTTSSGKLRRLECRARLLAGEFAQ